MDGNNGNNQNKLSGPLPPENGIFCLFKRDPTVRAIVRSLVYTSGLVLYFVEKVTNQGPGQRKVESGRDKREIGSLREKVSFPFCREQRKALNIF